MFGRIKGWFKQRRGRGASRQAAPAELPPLTPVIPAGKGFELEGLGMLGGSRRSPAPVVKREEPKA